MSLGGLVFFALFVLVEVGGYLAIRRRWGAPVLVTALCIFGGIVTMFLFGLGQGNVFEHAALVGLLIGGGIATIMSLMALYFHAQEARSTAAD